ASLALARSLAEQGRYAEADEALRSLEPDAREDAERATVAELRARLLAGRLARGTEASAVVARARASVTDPTSRARLALSDALVRFRLGRPDDAADAAAAVADDAAVEETVRLEAIRLEAQMLAHAGRCDEAVERAGLAVSTARRLADPASEISKD